MRDPVILTALTHAGEVMIGRWAMRDIVRMAEMSTDGKETGGILLGFDAEGNAPLTVTVAGDPGPKAIRCATRFRRDLEHAQALADAAWALEGSLWIGDWHTHPAGHPQPSPTDLAGYRAALADETLPAFLSVILSPGEPGDWQDPAVCTWLITAKRVQETPLLVVAPNAAAATPVG